MSDITIPVPIVEQSPPAKEMIVTTTLVVRGRLDVQVLEKSLGELVETWPILKARMFRIRKSPFFEYRVPLSNMSKQPNFVFTFKVYDKTCEEIPARKGLVSSPDISTIMHLFRSPESPRNMTALLKEADTLILRVHVTVFTNVTCIGISLPHLFADMLGTGIILRGWTTILCGGVPPHIVGPNQHQDALRNFGDPYPKTKVGVTELRSKLIGPMRIWTLLQKLQYYSNPLKELVLHPKEYTRLLFIPDRLVVKLRTETIASKGTFVSENDIVSAIVTKLGAWYQSKTDKSQFYVAMAANLRSRVPELSIETSWIHGALVYISASIGTTASIHTMSIGQIALAIRNAVIEQTSLDQLKLSFSIFKECCQRQEIVGFCESSAKCYFISSWVAAGLSSLDFSAALQDKADINNSSAGKMVFAAGSAVSGAPTLRFSAFILSHMHENEEGEGGYWCQITTPRKGMWEQMENYLATL